MKEPRKGQGEKDKAGARQPARVAKAAHVAIAAPRFRVAEFTIEGTAPYVQSRFSEKSLRLMHDTQEAGSTAKKGRKRDPKDFQECYRQSMHVSREGWHGIPAPAFRNAMVSACRTVGFRMTLAKLSVFTVADGFDKVDGTPLVRITKGEPHYHESPARNDNGSIDLRARAMWDEGWRAVVRVKFDEDLFTVEDVANLLMRVGQQVGIGEGRHDSRNSCGQGWGEFRLLDGEARKGGAT